MLSPVRPSFCPSVLHIGADSTGATGACAPVLIKEPGQRSPFAPVTFREFILDCASTGVFGLSVTPSVRRSVRLEMLRGGIHVDSWAFSTFLTVYQVLKGDDKLCSVLTHSLYLTYEFNNCNMTLKPASAYGR